MFRPLVVAIPVLLIPLAASVPAPAATAAAEQVSRTGERCDEERNERRRQRGRGIGGFLGGVAGGFIGGPVSTVTSVLPVGSLLGEAFASLLDCREQRQAAAATEQAVAEAERGGDVGSTANWESETRPGVTGSSTVTAVNTNVNGDDCMTVTDVVIIDGQETTAPKTMCRRPPTNRYVRV